MDSYTSQSSVEVLKCQPQKTVKHTQTILRQHYLKNTKHDRWKLLYVAIQFLYDFYITATWKVLF